MLYIYIAVIIILAAITVWWTQSSSEGLYNPEKNPMQPVYDDFKFYDHLLPASPWERTYANNIIHRAGVSTLSAVPKEEYGENAIIVGLHYTTWSVYCDYMMPIWDKLKAEFEADPKFSGIMMVKNDEQLNPTRGIKKYPTIRKYIGGKARDYEGIIDYYRLRNFILSPNIVNTYGSAW